MRVEVRLFATLARYLPPGSREGATTIDIPDGATVRELARGLGVPPDLERVILVNGRDASPDQPLHEGDVVSLFPPLAGGHH